MVEKRLMKKTTTCPKCGQDKIPVDEHGIFTCYKCMKVFRLVRKEELFQLKNLQLYGKTHRN